MAGQPEQQPESGRVGGVSASTWLAALLEISARFEVLEGLVVDAGLITREELEERISIEKLARELENAEVTR